MDRIFYSNEEFAKASEMSLKRVDLNSQADYDALTSAQKNDGTKLYFIDVPEHDYLYKWDFTKSLVDEVQGVTATLIQNAQRDSTGLHTFYQGDGCVLADVDLRGKTLEVFVDEMDLETSEVDFIYNANYTNTDSRFYYAFSILEMNTNTRWRAYLHSDSSGSSRNYYPWPNSSYDKNYFSGKVVKIIYGLDGHSFKLYANNELISELNAGYYLNINNRYRNTILALMSMSPYTGTNPRYKRATISKVYIYENEEEEN